MSDTSGAAAPYPYPDPAATPAPDPYTARLFQIESGGNPNAVSGSNQGLGQFGPGEQAKYGITDPTNPQQQISAVAQERADQTPMLASKLGRDPTPGELYLTHQQGVAGGPALLTADPSLPAWQAIRPYYKSDAVAQRAITGNIPKGSPLYGSRRQQHHRGTVLQFLGEQVRERDGAAGAPDQRVSSPGAASASAASSAPRGRARA